VIPIQIVVHGYGNTSETKDWSDTYTDTSGLSNNGSFKKIPCLAIFNNLLGSYSLFNSL